MVVKLLWSSFFVTLMAKKYWFMQFEPDMVFDTHWNYEGAHDYTWHMQIPLLSDRVPPRCEIHIDLCIHSSRYWNTAPLARCHTGIQLYSYFVLHERIHNTQWMLSMYTVPPDRYEEVILLSASAANPGPSVKYGWQVLMWYGDPLYSQRCCGHRDQEYCSYNVPLHFSETDRWNRYTIFDLPAQQWNFEPACSQTPCVASRVCIPAFSDVQSHTAPSLYSYTYEWWSDCNGTLYAPDKRSCCGIRPLHCARGKSPGSAPVP